MFIDRAKIRLKAGDGGNGCVSFRREKYVPFGGPDGGDGGDGGSIFLRVNPKLSTLADFHYKNFYKADRGEHGKGSNKHGKKGEDLYLDVPPGTQVFDEEGNLLADLVNSGEIFLAAKGGKGGRGNAHFANAIRRAPRFAEKGEKGEEKIIVLELKLLADVGIIGFPNAGKSTLLATITKAHPKIADYPFTTIHPNLGAYITEENVHIIFADIPGLIEGASKGEGLGHQFLKHIQRTKILLHLIDVSFKKSEEIIKTYNSIRNELATFDRSLIKKEEIIVFNKMDLIVSDEELEEIEKAENYFKGKKKIVVKISNITRKGLDELIKVVLRVLKK